MLVKILGVLAAVGLGIAAMPLEKPPFLDDNKAVIALALFVCMWLILPWYVRSVSALQQEVNTQWKQEKAIHRLLSSNPPKLPFVETTDGMWKNLKKLM